MEEDCHFNEPFTWLVTLLFDITIANRHTEYRLGLLGWFHFVGLSGLGGIVVPPEPDHLGRELGCAVAGIVRALAETKVEVVALKFQRVGEAKVGKRPTAPTVRFDIFGAVLHPNANITLGFAQDLIGKILAAVLNVWIFPPLDAAETANPRNNPAELVRHLPCRVEGTDSARREASDGAAVSVLADIVLGGHFGEHFIAKVASVAVAYSVIERAAHGTVKG